MASYEVEVVQRVVYEVRERVVETDPNCASGSRVVGQSDTPELAFELAEARALWREDQGDSATAMMINPKHEAMLRGGAVGREYPTLEDMEDARRTVELDQSTRSLNEAGKRDDGL